MTNFQLIWTALMCIEKPSKGSIALILAVRGWLGDFAVCPLRNQFFKTTPFCSEHVFFQWWIFLGCRDYLRSSEANNQRGLFFG